MTPETLAMFSADFKAKGKKEPISADSVIEDVQKPKRKRKSMAQQKKRYEHVTKDVPEEDRLSNSKLLALGKESITGSCVWGY